MDHFTPAAYFDILGQAQKAYGRHLEPVCKAWGLTRNELDILLFLYNNPESDRAADIVSRRGIAKSHVSLSTGTLEEKGLLLRQFSETDRRTAHLKLTKQGQAIAAQGRERQKEFFGMLYEGISGEELAVWKKISQITYENLKNANKNL